MNQIANQVNLNAIEKVLLTGDLSALSDDQRLNYYKQVCESVGLNWLTKPFEYMRLNGKLTLYATKGCTDQLRSIHNISIKIVGREKIDDIYIVTAQATKTDGRCDESTGAVSVQGLKGENMANAYLKCESKAKRRVTLSICGLNFLDEMEVESIDKSKVVLQHEIPKPAAQVLSEVKAEIKEAAKPQNIDASPADYVVKMGKHSGKQLKNIPHNDLETTIKNIKANIATMDKRLVKDALELASIAQAYLDSLPKTEVVEAEMIEEVFNI